MRNAQLLFDHDQNIRLLHVFDYMSIEEWLLTTKKRRSFLCYLIKVYSLCRYLLRLDTINMFRNFFFSVKNVYWSFILWAILLWICVFYKKPAVKLASGINKN